MRTNSIVRGTSPTLNFTLPFAASEVSAFYLSFRQEEKSGILLEKQLKDCSIASYSVVVPLSQTDTLALYGGRAELQVRLRAGGQAYASPILSVDVLDVIKNEVI